MGDRKLNRFSVDRPGEAPLIPGLGYALCYTSEPLWKPLAELTGSGPTGAVGAVGATGPVGSAGATGLAGATGTAGGAGAVGATGPVGATGLAGSNGAVGGVGATGPRGATGATGPQGASGATGAVGTAASTGFGAIRFYVGNAPGATTAFYPPPATPGNTDVPPSTEYSSTWIMGASGTYTKIYASHTGALASSNTYTVTLRVNGVDTGLTFTMAAGGTSGSASGSVSVVAGDRVTLKYVQSGTANNSVRINFTVF